MSKKFKTTATEPDENGHVFVCVGKFVRIGFSSAEKLSECKDAEEICNQRANLLLDEIDDDEPKVILVDGKAFSAQEVRADILLNLQAAQ